MKKLTVAVVSFLVSLPIYAGWGPVSPVVYQGTNTSCGNYSTFAAAFLDWVVQPSPIVDQNGNPTGRTTYYMSLTITNAAWGGKPIDAVVYYGYPGIASPYGFFSLEFDGIQPFDSRHVGLDLNPGNYGACAVR